MPANSTVLTVIDVDAHVRLCVHDHTRRGADAATRRTMGEYLGDGMPIFALPDLDAADDHKPDGYIDLSGWPPRYCLPRLVRYASTALRDRVPPGSGFPVSTPGRRARAFDQLPIRDHVLPAPGDQSLSDTIGEEVRA